MNKILILTRNQKNFLKEVQDLWLQNVTIVAPESEEEIKNHIVDANIIYGIPYLINSYIHLAKKLEWVQSTFAGVDALIDKDLRQDYVLTNVKDVYGAIMSEYVLWYILMFEKNILWNIENQKNKFWDQKWYPSLDKKTVWIMWTGSIGQYIAKALKNFWIKTLWFSSSGGEKEYFDNIYTSQSISHFLWESDYVISVLPNTQTTDGIVNKDVFSMMKDSAIFINVWRGINLVEGDLINAIKNKIISWAVLDVFRTEPLPENSELWDLENVYITPHISWYDENNEPILKIFCENYERFVQWKKLLHTIDFNKGY